MDYCERINQGAALLKQGMEILQGGPLDFYLRHLTGVYKFAQTLAPYQPGTRLKLTKTPVITTNEKWGWLGAKHVLVAGAIGTVREVEVDCNGFSYLLDFESETWIAHHSKVVHPYPPEERHLFRFGPDEVTPDS